MELSPANIVLAAKQHQIAELKRLATHARLVATLGSFIHSIQAERGATSIFLASGGQRFAANRLEMIRATQAAEVPLRAQFVEHMEQSGCANARFLSLVAWTLLGLDALPDLRARAGDLKISADEAITAYSRLIGGLVALIFELADSALDPSISTLLVALFNLIQGKELAGQERALGGLAFASGHGDPDHLQRLQHLIDAQDRNFQTFVEHVGEPLVCQWQTIQAAPYSLELTRLRSLLYQATPDVALEADLSSIWFDCSSERLTAIWSLQCNLVEMLNALCAGLIAEAERDLTDAERLLENLRSHPPAETQVSDHFFDPRLPVESALHFMPSADGKSTPYRSVIDLLRVQSQRLAKIETELDNTRRALQERKVIERAKGLLMARYKLSEDAAYKMLRGAAMDQNRRLAEIAESMLTLSALP